MSSGQEIPGELVISRGDAPEVLEPAKAAFDDVSEVMAWVMARVTGRSFAQFLHDRLWAPLGCDEDGYLIVDSAGIAMAGAGLSASLRDLARFGELTRCEGAWRGKQLTPATVVHDVQKGDHPPGSLQAFRTAASGGYPTMS